MPPRRLLVLLLVFSCIAATRAWAEARWSQLLPTANGGGATFDPGRRWMILPGPETWVLDLSGGPNGPPTSWLPLAVVGTPPPRLQNPMVAFDPGLDAVVVFRSPADPIWMLHLGSPAEWTHFDPSPIPPLRDGATNAYDSRAHRILRFGGHTPGSSSALGYKNDLWQATLVGPSPSWQQIETRGSIGGRAAATAVYDSLQERLLLFGGFGPDSGGTLVQENDAWALTLSDSTWRPLAATGSPPSLPFYGYRSFYDEAQRDLVIRWSGTVTGGEQGDSARSDVWKLSTGASPAWSLFYDSSSGGVFARDGAEVAMDPVGRRLLVHGGARSRTFYPSGGWSETRTDTWQLGLDVPEPTRLPELGWVPEPRSGATLTYDPANGRDLILVGGLSSMGTVLDDVWMFEVDRPSGRWSVIPFGPPPFPARAFHTAVYDSTRRRLVVFGGSDGRNDLNDVWALPLYPISTWEPIIPAGTAPAPRSAHTAIYDPIGDRMITFGDASSATDTWSLAFSPSPVWMPIPGPGPPAIHGVGSALFDPSPGRMVLVWGAGLWTLDLRGSPVWNEVIPEGGPATDIQAGYDFLGDRAIRFETSTGSSHRVFENTLGEPPSGRIEVAVSGPIPDVHAYPALGFHPGTRSLYVFGGQASPALDGTSTDQTFWRLDLDAAPDPSVTFVEAESDPRHAMLTWQIHDAIAPEVRVDRREEGGGWLRLTTATATGCCTIVIDDSTVTAGTTYSYRIATPTVAGEIIGGEVKVSILHEGSNAGLQLEGPETNPTRDFLTVSFVLPQAGPARLDLLDLRGRIVRSMDVGSLGAGPHTVQLFPDQPARSSVYFLRLAQGSVTRLQKVVLIGR